MKIRVGKPSIGEIKDFLLKEIITGEDVILGPRIGADAAIMKTKQIIVAHVDPITGARKNIGKLAIMIASNDIVAAGAKPKYALICIILPHKFEEDMLINIQKDLIMKAREFNISIVGGHTEFSPIVNEPVIITTIIGEFIGDLKERMKEIEYIKKEPENYCIVQIKPVALEATAIIAHDYEDSLKEFLNKEEIEFTKSLIDQLSIYEVGIKLFENNLVAYAHDPTEGGIIVALKEMGEFLNVGFEVDEEKIMILDITKRILNAFKLNPLKSLSSGCLLCVIDKKKIDDLHKLLKKENIAYSVIGNLRKEGKYLIYKDLKKDLEIEDEREELWKLFGL